MSLRLRLLLVFSSMLGVLLVVTVGAALEFRELAARSSSATASMIDAEGSSVTEAIARDANTAALGLGILAAAALVFSAWASRNARIFLLDRLVAIDRAASDVLRGESTRRLGFGGDDELARVAAALDRVLDLRDRTESAMQGRNSELRALLVALLHHHPRPAAVLGIDGEIIVSTLTPEQEDTLRALAPSLRGAARTLLSRHFVSAGELTTELRVDAKQHCAIQALALGPQRILGWLATLETVEGKSAPTR